MAKRKVGQKQKQKQSQSVHVHVNVSKPRRRHAPAQKSSLSFPTLANQQIQPVYYNQQPAIMNQEKPMSLGEVVGNRNRNMLAELSAEMNQLKDRQGDLAKNFEQPKPIEEEEDSPVFRMPTEQERADNYKKVGDRMKLHDEQMASILNQERSKPKDSSSAGATTRERSKTLSKDIPVVSMETTPQKRKPKAPFK